MFNWYPMEITKKKKIQEPKDLLIDLTSQMRLNLVWKISHNTINHQEIVTY